MNRRPTNTNFIDPDDAPNLAAPEWREKFARAPLREGSKIVRRGRPRSPSPKQMVSLRLDREIVTYFKIDGPGWQTRINDVLREKAQAASIRKAPGNTRVKTLRKIYGAGFAKGHPDEETLANLLHELDQPLLSQLIEDQIKGLSAFETDLIDKLGFNKRAAAAKRARAKQRA
jgi:uncharacterized protein (DUF4415 family)